MRLFITKSIVLASSLLSLVSQAAEPQRPELSLEAIQFDKGQAEMSGAILLGDAVASPRLLIVADGPEDHFIYQAQVDHINKKTPHQTKDKLVPERFRLQPFMDLKRLNGMEAYEKQLATIGDVPSKDRRLDFEGLAMCGQDEVYIANERVRQIIKISRRQQIELLAIDYSAIPDKDSWFFSGGANAGFEGLSVDCRRHVLYVAKEREPRKIMRIDLATLKATLVPDLNLSNRAGQKVIDIWSGDGLMELGPDIADLYFDQDKDRLYVLERNTFEIARVNPLTGEVEQRVSYFKAEKNLYETGEPFGQAEILILTPTQILVGIDNNETPLTHAAEKAYGIKGAHGAVMYFKRPAGF